MKKTFSPTKNQLAVLENKNKNLIISASAGTGKTTVLIEKIADILAKKTISLSELLVVTFTRLAADEMKKKLKAKLGESSDSALLEQLQDIENCDISTMHSFCSNLIKKYFYFTGVDPAFAVMEENEAAIEKEKILDSLFDSLYLEENAGFLRAVEIFGSSRKDEGLRDLIKRFYQFKVCMPRFEKWYQDLCKKYTAKKGENFYTTIVNKKLIDKTQQFILLLSEAQKNAERLGFFVIAGYIEKQIEHISEIKEQSLKENISIVISLKLDTLNASAKKIPQNATKEQEDFPSSFLYLRDRIKKFYSDEKDVFTELALDDLTGKMLASKELIDILVSLTTAFEEKYSLRKKEKGTLDYNDLEHYALKILRNKQLCKEVQGTYKMVFIDEFQDTNEVQEEIISLIKLPKSLFLVGDVKQSIYAFRQCRPEIFVQTLKDFKKEKAENDIVYMNDNFRSNKDILGFVNEIFDIIMNEEFGDINYAETSRLQGEKTAKSKLPSVCLDVINEKEEQSVPIEVYNIEKSEMDNNLNSVLEARLIAKRIKEVVGQKITGENEERVIGYSDVVILSRTGTKNTEEIYRELIKLKIPVVSEIKQSIQKSVELKALINLLKVIYNPYDDIALAASLKSFFGKLTDEELLLIRSETQTEKNKPGYFYESVFNYLNKENNKISQKLISFFELLNNARKDSQNLTPHQLLSKIMAETDFRLFVSGLPNGELRRVRADRFIQSLDGEFFGKSIGAFLNYIQAAGDDTMVSAANSASNAVRLMTIHQSKGLEFPVVILCNAGGKFNTSSSSMELDVDFGVACDEYNIKTGLISKTLSKAVVRQQRTLKQKQEEMRILYVALTRAQYHLFITGIHVQDIDKTAQKGNESAINYLDWILKALGVKYGNNVLNTKTSLVKNDCLIRFWETSELRGKSTKAKDFAPLSLDMSEKEKVVKKITAKYAHSYAEKMELKAISSKLTNYKDVFGFEEENWEAPAKVLFDEPANDEIGIAYHRVFEKIDFDNISITSIKQTIEKLLIESLIDKEVAKHIDAQKILDVLHLEVFNNLGDKKIYRELPFMLKTKAENIFEDAIGQNETVFLQGVIDLIIIEKDKATIVDFKFSKQATKLKELYAKQLSAYSLAVREILKLKKVECVLVSVLDGKIIPV